MNGIDSEWGNVSVRPCVPETAPTSGSGAVFLSYASQDADAARMLCDALQSAGVEVWFDQSELRGGDAWDAKLRRQIRECALFMPIISANTQRRKEGYFRLEWRLAEQRTHLMGRDRAFLLPVCVDDTRDSDADVPDAFLGVQWTRLPGGQPKEAFVERVKVLLAHGGEAPPGRVAPQPSAAGREGAPTIRRRTRLPSWTIAAEQREMARPDFAFSLAAYYAAIGDGVNTVFFLRALQRQFSHVRPKALKLDPWYDRVRLTPEFQAYVAELSKPDSAPKVRGP